MTKFKLRKIAVAGVMALGIAAIVPAVNASANTVSSGKNGLGVDFEVSYSGRKDTLNISSNEPIFYTDTKNAKTKLPSADKWLRAEYIYDDGAADYFWEIDLSSYSKETVIYIANSTSAESDDILAVTIPAKSTLKVKLDNATAPTSGAFKFTTTSTKTEANGTDKYKYTLDKNATVSASDTDVWSRLQVKKSVASNWQDIESFFDSTTLSKLQNKGTTLQFRLAGISYGVLTEMSPEELSASKAIATKGAITSPEVPRYNILSSSITTAAGTVIKALSARASDIATVKIAKKANAPATVIDYDYFLATINKGSYVTLTEDQFNGLDSSNNKIELPKNWTKADKTAITLTQGSINRIAVKTEATDKKPESNIAYLALGDQPLFATSNSVADEANDLVIVSSTFDSTGNVKGAELYIKGMQGETYQYCFGKASDILNGDQFVADKTKVKWSKLVNNAAKNKAPIVAAKTATIKDLKGADTILVRKASDKNKGQFASKYIIFTKDGNSWKKSEQNSPSTFTNQIVISTPSAVTYDANEITCELPISVASATVTGKIEAKCGKNTVTGSAVAANNKLTVTIPRKANSGLEKENDKLTFTLTIEAGAVSDSSSLASNKSVNKIVLDTKAPKVTGALAKSGIITINFSEAIEMEAGAVKAVVVPGTPAAIDAKVVDTGKNKGKAIEIKGQTFKKNDEIKVDLDLDKIKDASGQPNNKASYDTNKVKVDTVTPTAIVIKAK